MCANIPPVDIITVDVQMPVNHTLGNAILYSCPEGKAFDSGINLTSAVCTPEGWFTCQQELNCSREWAARLEFRWGAGKLVRVFTNDEKRLE